MYLNANWEAVNLVVGTTADTPLYSVFSLLRINTHILARLMVIELRSAAVLLVLSP